MRGCPVKPTTPLGPGQVNVLLLSGAMDLPEDTPRWGRVFGWRCSKSAPSTRRCPNAVEPEQRYAWSVEARMVHESVFERMDWRRPTDTNPCRGIALHMRSMDKDGVWMWRGVPQVFSHPYILRIPAPSWRPGRCSVNHAWLLFVAVSRVFTHPRVFAARDSWSGLCWLRTNSFGPSQRFHIVYCLVWFQR
jgi:hypothetical protein